MILFTGRKAGNSFWLFDASLSSPSDDAPFEPRKEMREQRMCMDV